jgi:hypothetical protein
MKKILKYIPNKLQNKFDFYDTLHSINSMPIPKTSDVWLFESEIEIETKRHKIISIIEIEIQLK